MNRLCIEWCVQGTVLCVIVLALISSNQFEFIVIESSQVGIMVRKDSLEMASPVRGDDFKDPNQDNEHINEVSSVVGRGITGVVIKS